jgi:hypothetical protein
VSAVQEYIEAAPTPAEREARRQYMTQLRRRMDDNERADQHRIDAWQHERGDAA